MGIKLLLADPSPEWLNEAKNYFNQNDYEVEMAEDGRKAQLALYNNLSGVEKVKDKFFAIILNLDLKNHPGTQVLKYIKSNYTGLKVILTTRKKGGFEGMGIDRKIFEKQGIYDLFEGSFNLSQLRAALEGHQDVGTLINKAPVREGVSKEEEIILEDQKFTSIKIDEIVSTRAVQFDIYIRLDSGRYIKILHAGDSFSRDRINKYKNEKNIKQLYFLTEDRKRFIRMQNFMAEKVIAKEEIADSLKMQLLKNAGEKLAEELYEEGVKPLAMEQGKSLCNNIYDMVNGNNNLASLMKEYKDFDLSTYTHSYLVCLFSCMLVKQFEWESKIVNETVGLASLLHDIGKIKLDKSLVSLRPHQMTPEQLEVYKSHPEMGVEILTGNNLVSAVVKQVILQHHEAADGTGFPFGLKRQKILTFSRLIFMVDEFVHIMMEEKLSPPKALKKMLMQRNCVERFGSLLLENFIKVFVDQEKVLYSSKK